MINLNIGKKVKNWRIRRNLSQRDLAKQIDVSYSYISRIEVGLRQPTLDKLELIAIALEICPKDLFSCINMECENCTHNSCKIKKIE